MLCAMKIRGHSAVHHLHLECLVHLPWTRAHPINHIPSGTSSTIERLPFQFPLNIITCVFPVHHPRMSEYMSTDNTSATLPLSSSGGYIFPSSYFPLVVHDSGRKEGSKVSRHVRQHSGGVLSLVYGQAPPDIIHVLRTTAETVPDPNDKASHGCQSSHPYWSTPYNGRPRQSVAIDPLLESQRRGPGSPRPDASRDDGFLFSGSQDRYPTLCLVKDALSSTNSSLVPAVGSPPLSKGSAPASIPEGCQFSAPPASSPVSNTPVPNTVPSLRSREDQQYQEAWMRAFASVVTPVGTNGYRDKNVEAIIPYDPQGSSCQMSYDPRCILHPGSVPQPYFDTSQTSLPSHFPPVYASNLLPAYSPSQATPQHQNRAPNAKKRHKKKFWCPGCKSGFSQPQVLGRHIKDKHEAKQTCPFCVSFTWSRGRPHLYREHLQVRHPQVVPPEIRQKVRGFKTREGNLGASYTERKIRPKGKLHASPDKGSPLHNTSIFPCAKQ
ncbi:hypothetical protein EDB86DRAFT_2920950 [Lactarius hatsudake]|nr:hypothetical protein EDB86DRAFT_2920950 [Lactarius hatsudake]